MGSSYIALGWKCLAAVSGCSWHQTSPSHGVSQAHVHTAKIHAPVVHTIYHFWRKWNMWYWRLVVKAAENVIVTGINYNITVYYWTIELLFFFFFVRVGFGIGANVCGWDCPYKSKRSSGHPAPAGHRHRHSYRPGRVNSIHTVFYFPLSYFSILFWSPVIYYFIFHIIFYFH